MKNIFGIVILDELIERIYVHGIVPRGNITKLNEKEARLVTKEGYVFIITGETTTYIGRVEDVLGKTTYYVEWIDEKGNTIKEEERIANTGDEVSVTEDDKILEFYTFDESNVNNIFI